jgi:fatty acid desaturase
MTATISTTMSPKKPIDFVERNNLKAFREILRDWLAIALIIAFSIWANNIFVYVVCVWLIGAFQFALAEAIAHEAAHYNLFTSKAWNDHLEFLYAFPFFRTLYSYRKHHFPHHTHLGSEKDYLTEHYEFLGLNKTNKNVLMILFIKPILGFSAIFFVVETIHDTLLNFKTGLQENNGRLLKNLLQLCLFWLVVIFGFYWSGNFDILLLYWFVPLVWSYSFCSAFNEVHEHYNTVSGTRSNVNPFLNFIFHNGGYHYVHHLCPTIPWYNLPKAHQSLCPNNPDISKSFLESYRQITRDNSAIKSSEVN